MCIRDSTWTTGRVPYSTRCSRAGRVVLDKNMRGDELREEAIRKYEELAEACEKKHGHRKWWLHSEKQNGPSKRFGVTFSKPSWIVRITIEGVTLHVATCECEDDAGLMADFARVADGREPKNFPEFWDSIKARVEASENGDVPAAVAPVVFRGSVRVDGVTIGVSEACLLYTSPSPRDGLLSRMPSSA